MTNNPETREDGLSYHIGLIVGTTTGCVYGVRNPEVESDLDNPRHLLLQNAAKEPVTMVKVDRGAFMACMGPEDIAALLEQWHKDQIRRIMTEPAYDGPTYVEDMG